MTSKPKPITETDVEEKAPVAPGYTRMTLLAALNLNNAIVMADNLSFTGKLRWAVRRTCSALEAVMSDIDKIQRDMMKQASKKDPVTKEPLFLENGTYEVENKGKFNHDWMTFLESETADVKLHRVQRADMKDQPMTNGIDRGIRTIVIDDGGED